MTATPSKTQKQVIDERRIKLVALLQKRPEGLSTERLQKKLKTTLWSVRNDLDRLKKQSLVIGQRGHNGGWKLNTDKLTELGLKTAEDVVGYLNKPAVKVAAATAAPAKKAVKAKIESSTNGDDKQAKQHRRQEQLLQLLIDQDGQAALVSLLRELGIKEKKLVKDMAELNAEMGPEGGELTIESDPEGFRTVVFKSPEDRAKEEKPAKKAPAKKTAKKAAAKTVAKRSSTVAKPPALKGKTAELKKPSGTEHKMPEGQIVIQRIGTETIRIPILGTAPLITHKFSEKAKRQMLDAMQGRRSPKEPKDPQAEFEAAAYRHDDGGYGIPAIAFKSATVSAARLFGKSVSMVGLRQTIFVAGEFSRKEGMMLARINGEMSEFELTPQMREDVVRVGNGGTDLRYRPCWLDWEASLDVTYIRSMLTRDSVLSLVEAGGMTVGVGEWRPEKRGEYGTYMINPDKNITVLD